MPAWKGTVAEGFTPEAFAQYVAALQFVSWLPEFCTLHHTADPNLAQRPDGFTEQHIHNLASYYHDELGWSAGPHLFVDDHLIWVMTPLTVQGVHAVSFNLIAWGIEMLGDYDNEDFNSGRGALVRDNAVAAISILNARLGIDPSTLRFHRDDPRTQKTCPGAGVAKEAMIAAVQKFMGLA